MDEWLSTLAEEVGMTIGDKRLSSIAYADDLLILTDSRREASLLLRRCKSFLEGIVP